MAGPWEDYAPQAASSGKPWEDYAPAEQPKRGGATGTWDAPSKSDRLLQGLRDPIDGGAQLLTKMLPDALVSAGNRANNWLADKTGLVSALPEGGVDAQVRQREADYKAARGPDAGFDGMRVLGNVLSPANVALAARAPMAASLMGRMGIGMVTGAASAALNPVAGDDFAGEKLSQMGTGAAFGGIAPALIGALGRVISPQASTNPQLQLLQREGVSPTIGQTLGGWANRVEEKAMSLPIMGDAISAARERARQQFNSAAINRTVAPLGQSVGETGQTGIQQAGNLIGQSYDDAINQVKAVRFDGQFSQQASQLKAMAQSMAPDMAKRFNATFDDVLQARMSANGSMLGATFKQVDSKLGQEAAKFSKSADPLQKELGDAYSQLQALLKDQAARTNPGFAEALKKSDTAWANLVRVEGAGKAAQNADGLFTPAQLNMAIRQADQSTRGRSVARGTALMQDLGNAGQQVLGNKVPNSGTADRMMLGGAGLGAYFVNPAIPAGLLGGAALYSSPLQNLLRGMVAARPQSAGAVRDALLQASPGLLPGSAQVGLGLLD